MAGGILPQRPTPGGLLGTGNLGAPSGPQPGQARGIPQNTPGPTVPGVPDPDKLVELFTAYTSGQVTREDLISQLYTFSEGEGGILGLLESMEEEESVKAVGNGGQMNGTQPISAMPAPPVPPEPLDKRHQRISQLLQGYGIISADADKMSTELNPRMLKGGSALFQEGSLGGGGRIVQQDHPFLIESMREKIKLGYNPVTGDTYNWTEIPQDQESNYINSGGFSIREPGGGYLGTDTGTFKGMDQSDPNWVDPIYREGGRAEGMNTFENTPEGRAQARLNVEVGGEQNLSSMGTRPAMQAKTNVIRNQPLGEIATGQPTETGQLIWDEDQQQMVDSGTFMPPRTIAETGELVWDEETSQMVDSGTWMPPKATGGLDARGLAARQQELEISKEQQRRDVGDWDAPVDVRDIEATQRMRDEEVPDVIPTKQPGQTQEGFIPPQRTLSSQVQGDQVTQEGFIPVQPDVIPPEPEGGGRIKGLAQMGPDEEAAWKAAGWIKDKVGNWFNVNQWGTGSFPGTGGQPPQGQPPQGQQPWGQQPWNPNQLSSFCRLSSSYFA